MGLFSRSVLSKPIAVNDREKLEKQFNEAKRVWSNTRDAEKITPFLIGCIEQLNSDLSFPVLKEVGDLIGEMVEEVESVYLRKPPFDREFIERVIVVLKASVEGGASSRQFIHLLYTIDSLGSRFSTLFPDSLKKALPLLKSAQIQTPHEEVQRVLGGIIEKYKRIG